MARLSDLSEEELDAEIIRRVQFQAGRRKAVLWAAWVDLSNEAQGFFEGNGLTAAFERKLKKFSELVSKENV